MTWFLFAYFVGAMFCGTAAGAICDTSNRFSTRSSVGVAILAGLLCPVTLLAALAWLGWQVRVLPGVLADGVRALRSLRPPREDKVEVPRAVARPPEVQAAIDRAVEIAKKRGLS